MISPLLSLLPLHFSRQLHIISSTHPIVYVFSSHPRHPIPYNTTSLPFPLLSSLLIFTQIPPCVRYGQAARNAWTWKDTRPRRDEITPVLSWNWNGSEMGWDGTVWGLTGFCGLVLGLGLEFGVPAWVGGWPSWYGNISGEANRD